MRSPVKTAAPRSEWAVFLVTVGLSLTLLFLQKNPAVSAVRLEVGTILGYASRPIRVAAQFFYLWTENAQLRKLSGDLSTENSELRDAAMENERLRAMLEFRRRTHLHLMAAEVTAHPLPHLGGRLSIDAGRADGVAMNSAVITPMGLVGKITELAEFGAVVQTLVGNSYGVSVAIERTRMMGILRWVSPGRWQITGLPSGADVIPGDLVITSGEGLVFPSGIRVGLVSRVVADAGPMGRSYDVMPFVDFPSVEEVFIVTRQGEARE